MGAHLELPKYKITVDEYQRMGEAGILEDDARVELIEGELIEMAPIGKGHASIMNSLNEQLVLVLHGKAIVSNQNPVVLSKTSAPNPDFAVLKNREDRYRSGLPTITDVLLLIEVADSSAERDRTAKIPFYAKYGVPEVWLFDLASGRLEIYREPGSQGSYGSVSEHRFEDTVSPLLLPDVKIDLSEIFT